MDLRSPTVNMVIGMVNGALGPQGNRNKVLIVPLQIAVTQRRIDVRREQTLTFLFHRWNGQTAVMVPIDPEIMHTSYRDRTTWRCLANHESAWRIDGVRDALRGRVHTMMKDMKLGGPFSVEEFNVLVDIHPFSSVESVDIQSCKFPEHDGFVVEYKPT